ncbi:signal peptidase I [Candidatus Wolfebacteria bacterium]|nr:signal peptidase I [Candidatus Wolfebacteria bacterium]
MKNKNFASILIFIIFLFASFATFYFFVKKYQPLELKNNNDIADDFSFVEKNDCVSKIEERVVRGNSLSGLIEPSTSVKILFGFYDCNKIRRGDIVAYNYAGNPEPIIKIVKGVEGDKFQLKKTSSSWNISINDKIVENSEGEPYVLNERGYKMLSLYERDYGGVIPLNAYLILGNAANGTLDSSVFGLIDKSDILGKVKL